MDKRQLAQTTTDPVILDELSKNEDFLVRCGVAENTNTSPKTLNYLSKDITISVRLCIARNLNTTPETLKQMSIVEESDWIKSEIQNNPNCLEETWKYLSALKILKTLQS